MELSTALLGLLPGALVPDEGSTAGLLALLKNSMGSPAQHRLRDIAQRRPRRAGPRAPGHGRPSSRVGEPELRPRLARPTLTQPRRWAWDLQIGALEAIEDGVHSILEKELL